MSLQEKLWLTFNGEIYNYIELRRELAARGREFRTGTDTEVVLHAYDEWGPDCLRRFNGMWSFALWDKPRGALFLAADCSGMKPLHYHLSTEAFVFASEIKALVMAPGVPRRVDRSLALLYLLTSVDSYEDRTFFEGVKRLPAGHAMLVDVRDGLQSRIWRWWQPTPVAPVPSLTDGGEMLHHLLRDSIKLRYRSDVPVGISLSGGLDSGGLVCIASDMARKGELQMPDGLRTFTAGTEDPALNEAPEAALLSSQNGGRPSSVCPTAAELRGDLHALVRGHDEPVRSLSTYMQFRVMRLARENGTVVILSGQGPDELLWGYPWQYPYAWRDLAASGQVLRSVGALVDASRHATVPLTQLLGYAAYAIAPGIRVGRYWSRIGRFLSREIKEDVKAASLVRACFRSLDGSAHFRQEVESTGLPSLLRYEDRNSMAFSVESRLPYLDPRILDLAYSVPSWTRVQGGWSKAILREALARVAPPELVWKRKKLGFGAPEVAFLTALIPEIQAAFRDSPRSASLLNPQAVRSRIDESVTPPTFMWRFLNLELWMRAYELTA